MQSLSSLPVRLLCLAALLPLLSGCIVATVAGVAVGAAKTTAKAAGTLVETAVDATTTTREEADEDRGKALRLEAERQREEAGRQPDQNPEPDSGAKTF
ncbi:MAG: hypothetical protein ACRC1J_12935 [Sandaracinobacteroides sp.]